MKVLKIKINKHLLLYIPGSYVVSVSDVFCLVVVLSGALGGGLPEGWGWGGQNPTWPVYHPDNFKA